MISDAKRVRMCLIQTRDVWEPLSRLLQTGKRESGQPAQGFFRARTARTRDPGERGVRREVQAGVGGTSQVEKQPQHKSRAPFPAGTIGEERFPRPKFSSLSDYLAIPRRNHQRPVKSAFPEASLPQVSRLPKNTALFLLSTVSVSIFKFF